MRLRVDSHHVGGCHRCGYGCRDRHARDRHARVVMPVSSCRDRHARDRHARVRHVRDRHVRDRHARDVMSVFHDVRDRRTFRARARNGGSPIQTRR